MNLRLSFPVAAFYGGLAILALILAASLLLPARDRRHPNLDSTGRVLEPSGLTYHPERGTLIAAGDEGQVAEFSLQGEVLADVYLGGDFEGITCDPDRRRIYVVEEKDEALLVLDWDTLAEVDRWSLRAIAAEAGLPADRNDGFEGIVYQPATGEKRGFLWLAHQHRPAMILRVEITDGDPPLALLEAFDAGLGELSGLSIDPRNGGLVAISDEENALAEISPDGRVLNRTPLQGIYQEGIAFIPNGDFYIADDRGGIFHYPAISD